MNTKTLSTLFLILFITIVPAQNKKHSSSVGLLYGIGSDTKTSNYRYNTQFYKIEFLTLIKESKKFKYEFLIQPKIEFKKYQQLNGNAPSDTENLNKYDNVVNINDYSLSFGVVMKKRITKTIDFFILGSVGPMITDTETPRLSKGFAFTDVFALGLSLKTQHVLVEIRPFINHISNLGIQKRNIGYNSFNLEMGVKIPI